MLIVKGRMRANVFGEFVLMEKIAPLLDLWRYTTDGKIKSGGKNMITLFFQSLTWVTVIVLKILMDPSAVVSIESQSGLMLMEVLR